MKAASIEAAFLCQINPAKTIIDFTKMSTDSTAV